MYALVVILTVQIFNFALPSAICFRPNPRYMSSSDSDEDSEPLNLDRQHVVKRKTTSGTTRTILTPAPEVPPLPTMLPRTPKHVPSSPGLSHIQSSASSTPNHALSSPEPPCIQRPDIQRSAAVNGKISVVPIVKNT